MQQLKDESLKQQEQLQQNAAIIQDYQDETKETERVLKVWFVSTRYGKRIQTWADETIGSPKPGLHLEDTVVQTILARWNVNDGTRQQIVDWCEAYLNQVAIEGFIE